MQEADCVKARQHYCKAEDQGTMDLPHIRALFE